MPIAPMVIGDLFTFRVRKYLSTNPDNSWINSYEFVATAAGGEAELLLLGTALVNFEIEIHTEVVVFDALLISTWVPDSVPYDPTSFISSPLTGVGGRAIGVEDILGLSNCMDVRRFAATGRYGHIFYRGTLFETDVEAPAGKTTLVDRPGTQGRVDAALTASTLGDFLQGGGESLTMCMINAAGDQVRQIASLNVGQVAQVKQDHRWFNRTTTP